MKVKLEELVEEVSERTTVNNQHPVLTSSRSGIYLQEEYFKKQVASKDNTGYRVIRKGEFTYRAMSDTGEFYPNKLECIDIGIVSPAYPVFKIRDNRILPDYLKYYFKSRSFQKSITAFVQGSTRASMKFEKMKLISIDLPDKDKQNQILNIIRILEGIIDKYKLEIDCLNNLIKARFVEMFGDSKEYVELANLSIGKSNYGAASASIAYDPMRPRYIRITDINDDGVLNDDYVCSINKDDDVNYKLEKGDFLFARMGATVGKTYYCRGGNQIFAGYLIRFRLNPEKLLPEYLYTYTQTKEYLDWVKLNQSGAAQPGINAQKYSSLKIPIASIEAQGDFAKFVTQVDKSKFAIQKSLEKTQLLFDSLMQEYFG